MATPKRAQNGKPPQQPRETACSHYIDLQSAQQRIRQAALADKGLRLTTLWHHVYNVKNACASLPEAGAQCGKSARWDLCGGCRVTGIPTAT